MKIEYQKGQVVGPHGIKFLEELQGAARKNGSKRIDRIALFQCGKCDNTFKAAISEIKSHGQFSCGCARKIDYKLGDVIGDHGIKYLKEADVIRKDGVKYPRRRALFLCGKCQGEFVADITQVSTSAIKSCGCLLKTCNGLSILDGKETRIHYVWRSMISRCHNKKHEAYKNYGGRGIKVCDKWKQSFLVFHEWAISHGYQEDLQIDRKKNEGDYSPDNCRFVTPRVNQSNRRNNHYCYVDGEKVTISEAARRLGKSHSTLLVWAQGKYPSKVPSNLVFEEPKSV